MDQGTKIRLRLEIDPGPLTAREALVHAELVARKLDSRARFTSISSGIDLNAAGRSLTWYFSYELPTRGVKLALHLEPCGDVSDPERDALCLAVKEEPILPALEPALEADLCRTFKKTPQQLYEFRLEVHIADLPPELPRDFKDSPDVVAFMAAQGVDFITGPTDISIASSALKSGEAFWVCAYGRRQIKMPFRRDELTGVGDDFAE